MDECRALRHSQRVHDGHRSLYSEPSCDRVLPASVPRSELDPVLPGKVTGCIETSDELVQWIEANIAKEVPVNREPSSDELIAYHLQNAREPKAYSKMATAMESFRAPPPWAGLLNKVSREHAPKKMQKRYSSSMR